MPGKRKPKLRERIRNFFQRKDVPRRSGSGEPSPRILKQLDLVEERLPRYIEEKGYWVPGRTMDDAARQIGCDKEAINYYFKERLQTDFRTWRTRLRIEDAKRIFQEQPDISASAVAERVGFRDRSNFSRQFALHTGCSITRWRAEHPAE